MKMIFKYIKKKNKINMSNLIIYLEKKALLHLAHYVLQIFKCRKKPILKKAHKKSP